MAVQYQPVIWNRNKLIYDAVLIACVVLYVFVFLRLAPDAAPEVKAVDGAVRQMRAWGTCAFLMLTVVILIGPLARLDRRFLPLLYNRRHFGVMTAIVASIHITKVLGWYFAFSPRIDNPAGLVPAGDFTQYVRLFESLAGFDRFIGFPIEVLGLMAFLILLVMAVTSHDFWMSFLTPPVWKAIHMAVYPCYGLVVMHVALGYVQASKDPTFAIIVAVSSTLVIALHLAAALREAGRERRMAATPAANDWLDVGDVGEIDEGRALIRRTTEGEKVAIFRYHGKVSAVGNACAHQNGPLGEGRIIDGCITCPWHGFQYDPATGRSPPPFTEKIPTFNLRLDGSRLLLDPQPNPPGTPVEPVRIPDEAIAGGP
ncbi:MAG: Rieske 2Fe-2S domain-containing protein [Pseudomonadota bacterium]